MLVAKGFLGSWKAGALAPSLRPAGRGAAATGFGAGAWSAGGAPTRGFGADAFDAAATGTTDSLRRVGFNGFDGALCDALAEVLPGFMLAPLTDFLAVALVVFADVVLADAPADFFDVFLVESLDMLADLARAGFPTAVLGEFLRVFLDIRLPFVAFRRSTIRVLRVSPLTVGFAPAAGQV